MFDRGERIELAGLAATLGVGRTTLHSWFGTRDGLLGELLVARASPLMAQAMDRATGAGAEYVHRVFVGYNAALSTDTAFIEFVRRDPTAAQRMICDPDGPIHAGIMRVTLTLIRREVAAGHDFPPIADTSLALALVRLAEAFLLFDLVDGRVDLDAMNEVQAAMLGLRPTRP